MSHNDALNCPECENVRKMKVMQGSAFIHEGILAYWRRKKCAFCGYTMKTVEVPADRLADIVTAPEASEMTNGSVY